MFDNCGDPLGIVNTFEITQYTFENRINAMEYYECLKKNSDITVEIDSCGLCDHDCMDKRKKTILEMLKVLE
jgi:hypothetical protein